MLFVDNNSEIRDLFREVEGVSQHGLDELFDQDVIDGNRSFAENLKLTCKRRRKKEMISLVRSKHY